MLPVEEVHGDVFTSALHLLRKAVERYPGANPVAMDVRNAAVVWMSNPRDVCGALRTLCLK